ncbi:MAG TPA: hypothetical protein VGK81_09165 [Anaerolineae bacterium]
MQAWCVGMLSILADAYKMGAVIGKGASIRTADDLLSPDVMFVPTLDRKIVKPDAVHGGPLLAIDVIDSKLPNSERESLCRRYNAAHVLEYWQVEADHVQPTFYQASAAWTYDVIPPDASGMHFSTAIVELAFPVSWFRSQPDLFTMMTYWDIISDNG